MFQIQVFLVLFVIYVGIGTVGFIIVSGAHITILDAVYTNFRALTADFAELAPQQ